MFSSDILSLARKVIETYTAQGKKIVTAESCTGGLIGAALTEIPGSSAVMERGFISYSNDAKTEVLGILPEIIEEHGAVSGEVAESMAQGALDFSLAHVAISATGVAGPDGGTLNKPVGLVYLGLATRDGVIFHMKNNFSGDRDTVRTKSVTEALKMLLSITEKSEF